MGDLARTDAYDPMSGALIGAAEPPPDPREGLPEWAMGALANPRGYEPGVGMWPAYTPPKELPDVGPPAIPSGPTWEGNPTANRAADVMGNLAMTSVLPQDPLDAGLMLATGPGRVGYKIAAGAIGAAMNPDEAQAGKLGKVKAVLGDVLSPNPRAVIGGNQPSTGSLNPLDNVPATYRGKQPGTLTPEEWHAWGQEHGVDNLGPLSPLQTYKDMMGKDFQVPGGTEGKWTYYDTLHMKANPINPANVERALHAEMQRKLGRTMTPEQLSDADVWNGLVFGMTSPNNPLFPNQMTASRLRLRTPEMLDDLASMAPQPGLDGTIPTAARKAASDAIANRYGLGGAEKTGGLGTRGTADYTRIADLATMFKKDPSFFRKAEDESWGQAVERISSQVPGLSMKTGSFGTVWQNPATAAISAIDRHMARELEKTGNLFNDVAERHAWEKQSVNRWNNRTETIGKGPDKVKVLVNADNQAKDFSDLMSKSGSDGFIGEMLLDHVGDAATPKFRMAKGDINLAIPEHLANANWVKEPETVFKMGRAYRNALDLNQKLADENGLNLFMSQWMEWDRIRNRFEPHENMFPGLSKMPAMSVEQMREVDAAHRATGHKTYGKTDDGSLQPTRPLGGLPSRMGYLGIGGAAAMPTVKELLDRYQEENGGR
jgi:hypothetical protein